MRNQSLGWRNLSIKRYSQAQVVPPEPGRIISWTDSTGSPLICWTDAEMRADDAFSSLFSSFFSSLFLFSFLRLIFPFLVNLFNFPFPSHPASLSKTCCHVPNFSFPFTLHLYPKSSVMCIYSRSGPNKPTSTSSV